MNSKNQKNQVNLIKHIKNADLIQGIGYTGFERLQFLLLKWKPGQ